MRKFNILFLLLISCGILYCGDAGKNFPRAVDGVIDLRNWDFAKNGPVDLSGEWDFFWKEFYFEADFRDPAKNISRKKIKVPGLWNNQTADRKNSSGDGYATYRLRILLGNKNRSLAFMFFDMGTSLEAFANGKKLVSEGRPGKTAKETLPGYRPQVADYVADSDSVSLILHIANFHHKNGGAWETIVLGERDRIYAEKQKKIIYDFFIFGGIFIMGLYHLGLYFFRKRDRSPAYFSAVCFLFSLRILMTGEYYIIDFAPGISWEMVLKLEYLSFYIGVPFFVTFLHSLFPEEFSRFILRVFQGLAAVFSAAVVVSNAKFFSHTVSVYELIVVFAGLYSSYVIVRALFKKKENAAAFLPGFAVLFLTAVNDILYHNMIMDTGYIAPYGIFIFTLFEAFMLSLRFAKTVREHSEAKFKLLQDRMSPHFLFNSLNTVHVMLYRDRDEADRAIMKIAHNYRFLMDLSAESLIPFEEEWHFMKNYLELEELRFSDTLAVDVEKKDDFTGVKIPPLSLQPLVENSLKHGFMDKSGENWIHVKAQRRENKIKVIVEDNGTGIKTVDLYGRSLGNILNRLRFHFNTADLTAENRKEGGALVKLMYEVKKSG